MNKLKIYQASNVTTLYYDKLVTSCKIMIGNQKRSGKMLQLLIECKGKNARLSIACRDKLNKIDAYFNIEVKCQSKPT
jgi:hypothetical protein